MSYSQRSLCSPRLWRAQIRPIEGTTRASASTSGIAVPTAQTGMTRATTIAAAAGVTLGRRSWAPIVQRNSATSERQFINVLGRGGHYRRLLVESVRGAPVIERVAVEFEDRQTQVWDVKRRLPRGADQVIDLGGPKRIHRIVVYTDPAYRGQYSIYGA